ncbi:MAG: hypothetical protein KGH75_00445 [Rhodospirillales bacterium]|nr:hypothetical protein [Rhodospirillales bacterium]
MTDDREEQMAEELTPTECPVGVLKPARDAELASLITRLREAEAALRRIVMLVDHFDSAFGGDPIDLIGEIETAARAYLTQGGTDG